MLLFHSILSRTKEPEERKGKKKRVHKEWEG
jgi:hypothetical protein